MAASLEQIQILSREYDLAEHEYQKALDAMRRLVTSTYRVSMPYSQVFYISSILGKIQRSLFLTLQFCYLKKTKAKHKLLNLIPNSQF